MLEIASGNAGFPDGKVRAYREKFAEMGFELPEWKPKKRHAKHKQLSTATCKHLGAEVSKEPCSCGSSTKIAVHECNLLKTVRDTPKHCAPFRHSQFANSDVALTVIDCQSCPSRSVQRARSFGSAFRSQGTQRFVTSAQLQHDIKTLVGLIPSDVTAVAGVARSGLAVATMVSMYLHLPMLTIRQTANDVVPTGNGWRLGGSRHVDPKRQKVVVIDDTVMTGNSLRAIEPLLQSEFGNYITAAVYVNPLAIVKPDIWAVDLPWAHLLEWNLFNSVLSPNMACDFDGILCRDCHPREDDDGENYLNFINNAKPLYLPRKTPIPLIVTARIEKYRNQTEEWLRRHGVKWNKLIMHPAETLIERNRDNIAAFKAKHFNEWAIRHKPTPPPLMFIESDPRQAREIHRISKKMVVSPHSGEVFS